MCYVSKYLASTDQDSVPAEIDGTGRVWGVWYSLPERSFLSVSFHRREDWLTFLRRIRRWGKDSAFLADFREGRVFGRGSLLKQLLRGLFVRYVAVDGVDLTFDFVYGEHEEAWEKSG